MAYFKGPRDAFRIVQLQLMDQNRRSKCILGKKFNFFFCQFTILRVIQHDMTDFMHNRMVHTPIVFFIVVEYVPLSICFFYGKAVFAFLDKKPAYI